MKITNDTNRNWKICEYRFERENEGENETLSEEYEVTDPLVVLPKIVRKEENLTLTIKWTPKAISKKATAVGTLKIV